MLVPGHWLSLIPSQHSSLICIPTGCAPHWVRTASPAGRGAANDTQQHWRWAGGRTRAEAGLPSLLFPPLTLRSAPGTAGGWPGTPSCNLWLMMRNSVLCYSPTLQPFVLFPAVFIPLTSLDLHISSNWTGKTGIRILILGGNRPQRVTKQELRPSGRVGF